MFTCLHFKLSSVLLLRILFPLNNAISSFSSRQGLHLSGKRLKRKHFRRILHFILETKFLRFIFQNSFESSVSFLYAARSFMVTISFFKCGFCHTYINVLAVGLFIACDGGFIYNIFSLTVPVSWRKFFLYAVAILFVWT